MEKQDGFQATMLKNAKVNIEGTKNINLPLYLKQK